LIDSVVADRRGEWVFVPTTPLETGKRELSLSVRDAQGVETRSGAVVVLMVPDRAPKTVAAALTKDKAEPLAVLVSRDGATPSRVLQSPLANPGVGSKKLSISVVDYDETGNVKIGGKGSPGAKVQVYIDNRLVGRSGVGPQGEWTVGPRNTVDPGMHVLRVDATRNGKVVARVELPFSRADPATVTIDKAFVVVQPGNSLWRIARRSLGKGIQYIEIYNANQSKIVNPDLIFPGQVFSLPKAH
jgi:nucleoid-associated protein YgaU